MALEWRGLGTGSQFWDTLAFCQEREAGVGWCCPGEPSPVHGLQLEVVNVTPLFGDGGEEVSKACWGCAVASHAAFILQCW